MSDTYSVIQGPARETNTPRGGRGGTDAGTGQGRSMVSGAGLAPHSFIQRRLPALRHPASYLPLAPLYSFHSFPRLSSYAMRHAPCAMRHTANGEERPFSRPFQ